MRALAQFVFCHIAIPAKDLKIWRKIAIYDVFINSSFSNQFAVDCAVIIYMVNGKKRVASHFAASAKSSVMIKNLVDVADSEFGCVISAFLTMNPIIRFFCTAIPTKAFFNSSLTAP